MINTGQSTQYASVRLHYVQTTYTHGDCNHAHRMTRLTGIYKISFKLKKTISTPIDVTEAYQTKKLIHPLLENKEITTRSIVKEEG